MGERECVCVRERLTDTHGEREREREGDGKTDTTHRQTAKIYRQTGRTDSLPHPDLATEFTATGGSGLVG